VKLFAYRLPAGPDSIPTSMIQRITRDAQRNHAQLVAAARAAFAEEGQMVATRKQMRALFDELLARAQRQGALRSQRHG